MRRWRKSDEEILTFDDLEEDDAPSRPRRRYSAPKPLRTRFSLDSDNDEDDEEEDDESSFESLEPLIRAGEYVPKPNDPHTAHILYQCLLDLGEI